MTNMDRKIKELNERLGRKTGVDFKESIKAIGQELYKNKPYFYGTLAGLGLFVLTSAGFLASIGLGVIVGYIKSVYDRKSEIESEIK